MVTHYDKLSLECQEQKQEQKEKLSKLDRLQVRAFQSLFYCRVQELGSNEAFATAIADTCDNVFQYADKKLIEKWLAKDFSEYT